MKNMLNGALDYFIKNLSFNLDQHNCIDVSSNQFKDIVLYESFGSIYITVDDDNSLNEILICEGCIEHSYYPDCIRGDNIYSFTEKTTTVLQYDLSEEKLFQLNTVSDLSWFDLNMPIKFEELYYKFVHFRDSTKL